MTSERPDALQAWTVMCEVVDRVRAALNRDLQRGAGLTLAENLLLCQVAMAPGQRLRMADIAGLLAIGPSAVTKTADRLEKRGLITRDRGPADRRTVYAALTTKGESAFAAARPAFLAAVQRHFAGQLTESQVRQLQHLSQRVLQPAPPAAADQGTGTTTAR